MKAGHPLLGTLLVVASAASFGAMGIFGKLAYDAGVGVLTLLVVRFALAAAILGAVVGARRAALPRGRTLAAALALGGIGYATQAALFFAALTRIDASLTGLTLYLYPALVTLAAVALGRDRLDAVRVVALVLSFAGLALVLIVGGDADADALGVALALGSAVVYSVYILSSERVAGRLDAVVLTTLVCAGAAVTFAVAGLASGVLSDGFEAIGWLWLGSIAVVSTVLAIVTFFAGLRLIGPSRASIVSTVEPVVTVALAFVVFEEALSATQLLGGALVLASVLLLVGVRRSTLAPS